MNLIAKLSLDGSGFDAGISRAKASVARFGTSTAGFLKSQLAGAFGAYAVIAATKRTIDWASSISDMSHATGISAEKLQQFEYAANQTGASLQDVTKTIGNIAKVQYEVANGVKTHDDAIKGLGMSVEEFKRKSPEDVLKAMSRAVKEQGIQKTFGAMAEIGGRSSRALASAFQQGFAEIADAWEPVDVKVIAKLDEAGDKFGKLASRLRAEFAPAIAFVADKLRDVWDLFQIGLGGAGVFLGNLSVTGSVEDAIKAIGEHGRRVIDERIADERATTTEAGRLAGAAMAGGIERTAAPSKLKTVGKIESDALARIGGSIGPTQDRTVNVLREQLAQLKRIEGNTGELVKKSDDNDFD